MKPLTIFLVAGLILMNCFFHVWCSGQTKEIAFQITKINQESYRLRELKRELKAELSRLKSPDRIEKLKNAFDLKIPGNDQIEIY